MAPHGATITGTLSVDAKLQVPWALDLPADLAAPPPDHAAATPDRAARAAAPTPHLCLVITHGASGDLSAGRLPFYARCAVAAGVPCLRLTCKSSSVPTRARAMQASMEWEKSARGAGGPL